MNDIIAPELILLPARTDSPKPWSKEILRQFSAVPSDCWHLKANHSKPAPQFFYFLDFFLSVEEAQSQERTGDEKATPYSFQTLLRLWGVTDWTLDIKLTRDWYCETDIFIYIFFYLHSTRKHNILLWQQKKTLPRMLEICLPRICRCF